MACGDARRWQRLRADHLIGAASQVHKMRQALERMNIKFHDVISDLTGVSGLKVVRAILQGERRPGERTQMVLVRFLRPHGVFSIPQDC